MKQVVQAVSYLLMFGGGLLFGVQSKPAEMALIIGAGVLGLVFSDIARFKRIKGPTFDVELWQQMEAVVEKETEVPSSENESQAAPYTADVDADTRAVMDALYHPEYTWRYLSGIRKDSGLNEGRLRPVLDWLVENSYARRSQGKHGSIWSLTEEGRSLNVLPQFDIVTGTRLSD